MRIDLRNIPGYVETCRAESKLRDQAFLDLNEHIAGVPVQPLSLLLFNRLDAVASPFIRGGTPQLGDIGIFLWIVSPRFREIRSWRDRLARFRFFRSIRKVDLISTVQAIYTYIDDAFMDSPGGGKNSGRKSYSSWNAILVDEFGAAYSWSRQRTQTEPLKVLFQLYQWLRKRQNPKNAFFNKRSDAVLAKWIDDRNQQRKAAAAQPAIPPK